MALDYPPVGFHFMVTFVLPGAGEADACFQEVSGLSVEVGVEEVTEGGENRFVHRLPARPRYGNLVLKRGLLTESALIGWFRDALENFEFTPADVMVVLLNEEHQPLGAWNFVKAWPVKWAVSDFRAQENSVAIETVELAYNYFRRVA